jgi:hypothetical protein
MIMELYLLEAIVSDNAEKYVHPFAPWYDRVFGVVVCAENELEARKLADSVGVNEKDIMQDVWLNPKYTSCISIEINNPRVILVNFRSA